MLSAGVRGRPPASPIGSVATVRQRCHQVSSVLLHDNVVVMQRDPLPVRERTRRAVRGELAQLAADLFVEKGYDETTIDDLAARPAGEPIWVSLRQVFGQVVDHVESGARGTASVAMEKIVRDHPALNASYLERVSRMQELLLDEAMDAIQPT